MPMQSDVFGVIGEKIVVGPGATLAFLVGATAGQLSSTIKYFSGGSLEIIQAPVGTTWAGASLVNLQGTGYLMGTSEAVNLSGPVRYYLMATGSTTVCYHIRGLSDGF